MRALTDLRVLDLSGGVAGPFCAKLLGDFGADVIKVEPPGGESGRGLPPHIDGKYGPKASGFFLYLNTSKRGIILDLTRLEECDILRRLIRDADVIIESFVPGRLAALELGYEELERLRPGIVLTSITPFGQEGPWRDLPINDLVAYAISGWASVNGHPEREPLKGSGYQASFQAGIAAFIGTMAAVVHRDRSGEGQHVDISILDPLIASFAPAILTAQYNGEPGKRRPSTFQTGPVPAADGHFSLTLSRAHFWRDAMNELGLPEYAQDERFYESGYRQAHAGEVAPRVEEQIAARGKQELFDALSTLRVVSGMVLTTEELFQNPHVRARGFLVEQEHPDAGKLEFPGAPFKMSETPWQPSRAAPRLGEHTAEILAKAGRDPAPERRYPTVRASRLDRSSTTESRSNSQPANFTAQQQCNAPGPLDGLRAVVLTQAWAGTFCTELLGFLGAEVIQIETRRRLDSWRGGFTGPPNRLRDVATAVHPWNCSPLYNAVNLNKRAITLDLASPEGLAIFKQLVMTADIVAENFTPRVMANLGLDFKALSELRPGLIMISMSAYGATGPYANTPGIGGTIEPMSGMSALLGYEDGPPINSGQMYPDPVAGYFGAAAVLIALHHRERTGIGQHIDLSMQETSMTFIADALMEYSANRRVRGRLGNHHPQIAPHNIYPCAGPGGPWTDVQGRASQTLPGGPLPQQGRASQTLDDRWIAISVADDREFGRLCETAGHPEWAADSRFTTTADRKQNEQALDAAIAAWTAYQDAFLLEEQLRLSGVTAGAVRNAAEAHEIEHLWRRGTLAHVTHPEAGEHAYAAQPWRLSRTPGGIRLPAPGLGEHGREVFGDLLGLGAHDYDRLEGKGVTGTEPYR